MIKIIKAIQKGMPTFILLLTIVAPAESQTSSTMPSRSNHPFSVKDIQAAADKINKNLDSYGPYLSGFDDSTIEPGINSASMLLYYTDAFFKNNSYKKLIIFYFSNGETRVDEYYPIKNKKYVVRMMLKTPIKPNRLNIGSFLHEYEQMKKTILAKYIFIDDHLVMLIGPEAEVKTIIDERLAEKGQILLEREKGAVYSVLMD